MNNTIKRTLCGCIALLLASSQSHAQKEYKVMYGKPSTMQWVSNGFWGVFGYGPVLPVKRRVEVEQKFTLLDKFLIPPAAFLFFFMLHTSLYERWDKVLWMFKDPKNRGDHRDFDRRLSIGGVAADGEVGDFFGK